MKGFLKMALGAILVSIFAAGCSSPLLNEDLTASQGSSKALVGGNYKKNYSQVYVRGTNNTWGTTAMNLVGDNTWELAVAFGYTDTERFKFDINADWSLNFGDSNKDGIGDQNGADIAVAKASRVIIRFNDLTKAYQVLAHIEFDCYAIPDMTTVPMWNDIYGLTVTLYDAQGKAVRTSTVTTTTTHGTYASFRNPGVAPGTYTAKIDEKRVTATQTLRYFAETTFTMTTTSSPSPNLTVSCEEWEADFDVYTMAKDYSFNDAELSGLRVDLYDALGNYAKGATIGATATHGVYASFRNLRVVPGTYTARIDGVNGSYHYYGTQTFTVGLTGPSPSVQIVKTFTGGTGGIYFDLQGAYGSQVTILNGLTANLYRDGNQVGTGTIAGVDYQQPYIEWNMLRTGTYTVKVDQVKNNVRYTCTGTFSISETAPVVSTRFVAQQTPAYSKVYDKVYFRGTWNTWGVTEMALVDNNTWRIVIPFGSSSSERFKFDIKGDWSLNFGDNNKDGVADQGGADIAVSPNTTYEILFNDSTKKYTVTKK